MAAAGRPPGAPDGQAPLSREEGLASSPEPAAWEFMKSGATKHSKFVLVFPSRGSLIHRKSRTWLSAKHKGSSASSWAGGLCWEAGL